MRIPAALIFAALLFAPAWAQMPGPLAPISAEWRICIEQNAAAAESLGEPVLETISLLADKLCATHAAAYMNEMAQAASEKQRAAMKKLCDRMRANGDAKGGDETEYCDYMSEGDYDGGAWAIFQSARDSSIPEATAMAAQILTKLRNERLAAAPK